MYLHDVKIEYKIVTVVGARPQFIKAAALSRAIERENSLREVIVHSGQHYDHNLSGSFFEELDIPRPKYNLGIGSASHNLQISKFLALFDEILIDESPDLVVVYGDTNTTAAGAIAAAKRGIPIAHVEAGLREWNKKIPEEVNKLLTDAVTDLFFSPTQTGVDNLAKAGVKENVFLTGDISLDLLYGQNTKYSDIVYVKNEFDLPDDYIFMTCHRDRNTDIKENLQAILLAISKLDKIVILPIHPRTKAAIAKHKLTSEVPSNLKIVEPLPFWTTQSLLRSASAAITDSGGVIKEAYFHKVPCVIIDQQTEWLEAVKEGWATVTGPNEKEIVRTVKNLTVPTKHTQALGDGLCGDRVVKTIVNYLNQRKNKNRL